MSPSKAIVRQRLPEEDELDKKLNELSGLESDLAQKELDLATLQAELRALELRYLQVVGVRLAALDDLRAQIEEAFARLHPKDELARKAAQQARARADQSATTSHAAGAVPAAPTRFRPSESMKLLYKEAAKRVHPDLASDEEDRERRTKVMAEINEAYKAGDEVRLRSLLEEWNSSPEAIAGDDVGARLVRTIRKITQVRGRLAAVQAEIGKLGESSIGQLLERVKKAEESGRDLLNELVIEVEAEILQHRAELNHLQAMLDLSGKATRKA